MPPPKTAFSVIRVGGVPFQAANLNAARDWVLATAVAGHEGVNVRLANAYNIALASTDIAYAALLKDDGVNFPDGTPVIWFMRLRSARARPMRVRGPSLFRVVLAASVERGVTHFFLGGTPETLEQLQSKVRAEFPGIAIAGAYSPPFAEVDEMYIADCLQRIRASNADLVWIGLGTPKQDQVGTAIAREADVVSVNVGAAFDFMAGTVREAPSWIQKSGFEWLYRFASEPVRLWRRYLIGNIQFLAVAIWHLLVAKRGRHSDRS